MLLSEELILLEKICIFKQQKPNNFFRAIDIAMLEFMFFFLYLEQFQLEYFFLQIK